MAYDDDNGDYVSKLKDMIAKNVLLLVEWTDTEKEKMTEQEFMVRMTTDKGIKVSLYDLRSGIKLLHQYSLLHKAAFDLVNKHDGLALSKAQGIIGHLQNMDMSPSEISKEALAIIGGEFYTSENFKDFIVVGPCPWNGKKPGPVSGSVGR